MPPRLEKRRPPARVKNPSSDCHVVPLVPGQKLEITLSGDSPRFSEATVEVRSEFLEMEGVFTAPDGNGRMFRFRQKSPPLDNWARVSNTHMGEVVLRGADACAKVCPVLVASNPCKKNVFTVVNPDAHTVKIQPYQILEVVLYNPLWGKKLYWEMDENLDPRMEILSYNYVDPSNYNCSDGMRPISDAFFTYPRSGLGSSSGFHEYHFWVRCRPEASKHMLRLDPGSYPRARMRFNGCVGMEVKFTATLSVNFNPRVKEDDDSRRIQTLTRDDSDLSPPAARPSTAIALPAARPSTGSLAVGAGGVYDFSSYANRADTPKQSDHHHHSYYGLAKRPWCSKQKLRVSRRQDPQPFSGCVTKFLDEIPETVVTPYSQYAHYAV